MIDDLISRQAVIDVVHHTIYEFFDVVEDDDESPFTYKDMKLLELNKSISTRVKDLPSAQPKRKKGKWVAVKIGNGDTRYTCSECGASYECDSRDKWDFVFCPNCGAQM